MFDPDNFLNNNGNSGTVVKQSQGECILDTGGYVFNTEAHPIDPDALKCCYDRPREQLIPTNFAPDDYLGEIMQTQERLKNDMEVMKKMKAIHTADSDAIRILGSQNGNAKPIIIGVSENSDSIDIANANVVTKSKVVSDVNEIEVITEINKIVSSQLNMTPSVDTNLDTVGEFLNTEDGRNDLWNLITKLKTSVDPTEAIPNNENATDTIQFNSIDERDSISSEEHEFDGVQSPTQDQRQLEKNIDWISVMRPDDILREPIIEDDTSHTHQFNVQRLLEKVRRVYNDSETARDYELLSCRSQTYLQRLAIHGEILT